MNVRAIEPPDAAVLIRLRGLTRENAISEDGLRRLGVTATTLSEKLRDTHRGWLCEEDGEIVGFAIGDGSSGELWVIAVLPAYEHRGIGGRLLGLVEEWLWSLGCEEIWLWTSADEKLRAFSFYIRHGWRKAEVKDDRLYLRKNRPGTVPEPTEKLHPGAAQL